MNTGDSFSRPLGIDGGNDDDGIGLPRRPSAKKSKGPRGPRRGGVKPSSWLWLGLWSVAAIGVIGFAARKEIASAVVQNWLHGQGIPGHVKLDRFSLSHAGGTLSLGPEGTPDVSVGHFDVDYNFNPFAGKGMPAARLVSAHVTHPVIALSFRGGKLNFGTLDKLINDTLSAPPSLAPPAEDIVIEDAEVHVLTDYGQVRSHGSLSLHQGSLTYLSLKMPQTHLSGPLGEGNVSDGAILARADHDAKAGDQLHVDAHLTAPDWTMRSASESPVESADAGKAARLQGVTLAISGNLPYRKTSSSLAALTGAVNATLALKAQSLRSQAASLSNFETSVNLNGEMKSSGKATHYTGAAQVAARADSFASGHLSARGLRLQGPAMGLSAAYAPTGVNVALNGAMTGDVAALRQDTLALANARVHLDKLALTSDASGLHADYSGNAVAQKTTDGDLSFDTLSLTLNGSARSDAATGQWGVLAQSNITSASGHYSGLHALAQGRKPKPGLPKDAPQDAIVALDAGLYRFNLNVKGLTVGINGGGSAAPQFDVRLRAPAVAELHGGGLLTVAPHEKSPVLASRGTGAFDVTLSGGNLPRLSVAIRDFGFRDAHHPSLISGGYSLNSQFSIDPVSNARLDAAGHFTTTGNGLELTLDGPAKFSAGSAELGEHVETVSATLEQTGGVFFRLDTTGWRVTGRYTGLGLTAPNEGLAVKGGQGGLEAFSLPDAIGIKASLSSATLSDALPADQQRFNPLMLSGTLTQDARKLTGRFTAKTSMDKPTSVASINLDNDSVTQKGSLAFRTLDLNFAKAALQPVDLSPRVKGIVNDDVTGTLSFDGAFRWDHDKTSSSGVLKIDGLDFTGALGVTHGLKGEIDFTSLAPLRTDPHQLISIANIQLGIPLSDLHVALQFQGDQINVEGADVMSPGGEITLAPTILPLKADTPITGAVAFNGLDFGKIIAATGLSQNMTFEGNLTGRLPFTVSDGHLTIQQGAMKADGPGRISIKRQSVTDMTATGSLSNSDAPNAAVAGAPAGTAFNPFQDLAFQAMEHISYSALDAKINSQPGGVLDTVFHIKGRFDPPQKQKATIGIADYISGKWMNQPIKLPSGTPVELYLDVPLNFDEILHDLTAFNTRGTH